MEDDLTESSEPCCDTPAGPQEEPKCLKAVENAIQHSLRRNARRCFALLAGLGGAASIAFDVHLCSQNQNVQYVPFTLFYGAFCFVYAIKAAMYADDLDCQLRRTARHHPEEFSQMLAERFAEAEFSGDEHMKQALNEVLNACWKERPPCDPPENP